MLTPIVRDDNDDVARIEQLDLAHMRAAVQEAANRLDNRALLVARVSAAVAGGVAGAVFGALAAHVF